MKALRLIGVAVGVDKWAWSTVPGRDRGLDDALGAVHSFFGRYGPQRGDGLPTVSRAEAEAIIAAEVGDFLDGVR